MTTVSRLLCSVRKWKRELLREKNVLDYSSVAECWYCTFTEDNGLNPVWLGPMNPPKCFQVDEPDLAFLRFVVFEEDTFSDAKFLAHATFPIRGIRSGKSTQ